MTWRIIQGDCREVLRTLPAESMQTCVTSPPYWGLRDYGHEGQLGLERTPEEYVARMVEALREVRRVLRPDGTLWLNLGDCYADGGGGPQGTTGQRVRRDQPARGPRKRISRPRLDGAGTNQAHALRADEAGRHTPALKPKDLVGIPWRVAFALQADGWWLRSDIVWSKPNPMPESVTDRPTKAHEYLFLMAKSERYFYDAEAIREGATGREPGNLTHRGAAAYEAGDEHHRTKSGLLDVGARTERNRRSVWTISTKPFSGAHFAVMPWDLVEPCVLAGSRGGGSVLDPFAGTGTVGMVARRHGRSFVGIEINPKYAEMARARILDDAPLLNGPGSVA